MPHTIKVSINEWATLDTSADAELMTSDLTGCVAIAVRSQNKIGLTHVYSEAKSPELFKKYEQSILEFMEQFADPPGIDEVHFVRNAREIYDQLGPKLEDLLLRHGVVQKEKINWHDDSGCCITSDGLYLQSRDNQEIYNIGFTNTRFDGLATTALQQLQPHFQAEGYKNVEYNQPADVHKNVDSSCEHNPEARFKDSGEIDTSPLTSDDDAQMPSKKSNIFDSDDEADDVSFPGIENDSFFLMASPEQHDDRTTTTGRYSIENDDFFLPASPRENETRASISNRDNTLFSDESPQATPSPHGGGRHANEKKRMRSDDNEDGAPARTREDSTSSTHEKFNPSRWNGDADDDAPRPKRSKQANDLDMVTAMLKTLPEGHKFHSNPEEAAAAILAFARKNRIHTIDVIKSTDDNTSAVYVLGRDAKGTNVKPSDALRYDEIKHHSSMNPSVNPASQQQQKVEEKRNWSM